MGTSMGNLKPGAKYIYERDGDTVFRREVGSLDREVVGYDHRTGDGRPLRDHLMEDAMWGEIRRMAKSNPSLQSELERVIMLYHLLKEEKNNSVKWHPV
jgi:hypothetical protein